MPAPAAVAACRHCWRVMATRSRGLCATCYRRRVVRLRYPVCSSPERLPRRVGVASCRRCGHDRVTRPRGLCWKCYYTPDVRGQYQPVSVFGSRVDASEPPRKTDGRLPGTPTDAIPKSDGKIAVMAERRERRETLFHPRDALHPDDAKR